MSKAENGKDALRISKEYAGQIELMITDVVMPKMGGKETAERLQPLYPQIKVIYMSGYTDDKERGRKGDKHGREKEKIDVRALWLHSFR